MSVSNRWSRSFHFLGASENTRTVVVFLDE